MSTRPLYIVAKGDRRLCRDRKFRYYTPVGNARESLQLYADRLVAERIVNSQNAIATYNGKPAAYCVREIPSGKNIDPDGHIA